MKTLQQLARLALEVNTPERERVYRAFAYTLDFQLVDSALEKIACAEGDYEGDESQLYDDILEYGDDALIYYSDIAEYYARNPGAVDDKIKEGAQSVAEAVNSAYYEETSMTIYTALSALKELYDEQVDDSEEDSE